MSIKIVGSPDKDLTPYIHRAAKFFADSLLTKQMQDYTYIIVKFDKKLDEYGAASVEGYNSRNMPREFLIEINPHLGARGILETLAHEMVHVKQFALGELIWTEKHTHPKWQGRKIDYDATSYWDLPYEIEAHGREKGLVYQWCDDRNLLRESWYREIF